MLVGKDEKSLLGLAARFVHVLKRVSEREWRNRKDQRLSELEVYPNERIPKIFALPERIPNELLKKPRIPKQTRTNQFYYLNVHRLSFAPRKHGFSINIAEKLFLEILVLHGGRTGTNQMTSNTKNLQFRRWLQGTSKSPQQI